MPRHQTLRAAIDWSYGLLPPGEKTALHRLSVFGFLPAADYVNRGGTPVIALFLSAAVLDTVTV